MDRTKYATLRSIAFAVVLVALAAGNIVAAASDPVSLRWSELNPVLKGRVAAVILANGVAVEGKFSSLQADTLTIHVTTTTDPGKHPVGLAKLARPDVSRLILRRHSSTKGRVIGFVVGIGIAATAGAVLSVESKNETGKGNEAVIAGLGAGLIGIGGLAGWIADSAGTKPEQTIFLLPN